MYVVNAVVSTVGSFVSGGSGCSLPIGTRSGGTPLFVRSEVAHHVHASLAQPRHIPVHQRFALLKR